MRLTAMVSTVFAFLVFIACNNANDPKTTDTKTTTESTANAEKMDSAALIKRGQYLTTIGGCNDCHTPKMMTPQGPALDVNALLSGYSSARPFTDFDKKAAFSGKYGIMSPENTAYAGPWGVSYAANLTPDETGIGNWTYENFKIAMTKGKWKGLENSRPLMPPMPWENFKNATDEDLSAMFAYLKSLKPVKNAVPGIQPPQM